MMRALPRRRSLIVGVTGVILIAAIVAMTVWHRQHEANERKKHSWVLVVTIKSGQPVEHLIDMRQSDDELNEAIRDVLAPLFQQPFAVSCVARLERTQSDPYDLKGRKTSAGHVISDVTTTWTTSLGPFHVRRSDESEGDFEFGQQTSEDQWQSLVIAKDLSHLLYFSARNLSRRMRYAHQQWD